MLLRWRTLPCSNSGKQLQGIFPQDEAFPFFTESQTFQKTDRLTLICPGGVGPEENVILWVIQNDSAGCFAVHAVE